MLHLLDIILHLFYHGIARLAKKGPITFKHNSQSTQNINTQPYRYNQKNIFLFEKIQKAFTRNIKLRTLLAPDFLYVQLVTF